MPRFRRIRDHDPKSYFTLIIDILTFIPFNGIYYLFCYVNGTIESMNASFRRISRIKTVVRLYRVYLYSLRMKKQAGRNQLLIISLAHLVLVALLAHVFGTLWYAIRCYKCEDEEGEERNWTYFLDKHIFDPSSIVDWFIICTTNIGIALQHCYKGK